MVVLRALGERGQEDLCSAVGEAGAFCAGRVSCRGAEGGRAGRWAPGTEGCLCGGAG